MSIVRSGVRRVLGAVDRLYRKRQRLRTAGPLLFIGLARHHGPPKEFDDGTRIDPGDPIGTLHFNNAQLAGLDGKNPTATGLRFRRLLFQSLRELAKLPERDEAFRDVAAYRGVTWIRHGASIGFEYEPLAAKGWRNRYAIGYIRLLVWAFASENSTALTARPELTTSWLTRRTLEGNFARGKADASE